MISCWYYMFSILLVSVEEDVGSFSLPVLRRVGMYGQVSVNYTTRSLTAQSGLDYILANGTVTFRHDQNVSHINVSIVDDLDRWVRFGSFMCQSIQHCEIFWYIVLDWKLESPVHLKWLWYLTFYLNNNSNKIRWNKVLPIHFHREYNEVFEIQLTAASGGAILGTRIIAQITIAKSDSPSGMVRFVNQSVISIPNPDSTLRLSLVLERSGGFVGDATVSSV